MSFTNELSVIPTDERGKQMAAEQIINDLQSSIANPVSVAAQLDAILEIYNKIKPFLYAQLHTKNSQ